MEDFLPYELAVKLKEKGFNEDCYTVYNTATMRIERSLTTWKGYKGVILAPPISQVLKWIREEKDVMVFPVYSTNTSRWYCSIVNADSLDTYKLTLSDSYELAAIAGIEYCFLDNLI